MRSETAAALRRINRRFYRRHAAEFSVRRGAPWPGWQRVASSVERRCVEAEEISVLDLGCGNGRLASFLDSCWAERLRYLGVDESAALLEIATGRVAGRGRRRLLLHDLAHPLPGRLPGEPFDLVAVFGLMHHLPGVENRRRLLRRAAERLVPGGMLAVSFWQFGGRARFERRSVGWEAYNRTAAEPIDVGDLEAGDRLLRWGAEPPAGELPPALRYCHWTPPAAARELFAGLPLAAASEFTADGRGDDLNLYHLLLREPGSAARQEDQPSPSGSRRNTRESR